MDFDAIRRWFLRLVRRALGRGREPDRGRARRSGGKGRSGGRHRRPPTALGTFGTRMGRHAGIYGGGQAASLVIGLITLTVLTRFLDPAQFGQYALYYVFANMLGVIYTLGWVRGVLILVFGGKGGDEDDDDEEDDGEPIDPDETARDKRAALGSGIVFIALIAAVGTAIVATLASTIGSLAVGESAVGRLTVLAAVAGGTGAAWILASSIPRRERRPTTFVLSNLSKPVLVLVLTVPLVAVDPSVESAVLGLALGNTAALLFSLLLIRGAFRLTLTWEYVKGITRNGLRYTPVIVGLFVIANGGVILLGHYVEESDVGLFRVATGLAALASLPMGAFVTAWGPLRREPIYGAVTAERGKQEAAGLLATYFILAAIGILLVLALGADLLVQVAPVSYADAAPLIPIVGLGLLLYGLFRVVRRSAKFPNKANWYIVLASLAAIVFVGVAVVLIPPLGTYGAALAGVAAFLFAACGIFIRAQVSEDPIPLAYGRILAALAIAAGCYAAGKLSGQVTSGIVSAVIDMTAILAYPVLLALTRIVPRAHLLPIGRVAKAALPGPSPASNGHANLNVLDPVHRALLEVLVRHRRPVGDVAPVVGVEQATLEAGLVEALREVAGVKPQAEADPRVGAYLLSSAPVAARDVVWQRLSSEGADALEVDVLSLTLQRLRRAPDKAWRGR